MGARVQSPNRFALFATGVLIYNLVVILWGALVRATGSGAGCGGHWPLCNGVVVPVAPQVGTLIEYTHRLMSGLSLVLVAALAVWALRHFPKGHRARTGAAASALFIITEALIGAGLVLFGWVAQDVSVQRTASISLHLVNTFLLLGALTLTAWWAWGGPSVRPSAGLFKWALALGLAGIAVIGVTGAVTALGDTLFPSSSLAQGLRQDVSPTASFLIRLRFIHPLVAVMVGAYLLLLLTFGKERAAAAGAGRLEWIVRGLVLAQWGAGLLNIALLAPIWMQLVHLLLADLVWIALVLYCAALLGKDAASVEGRESSARGQLGAPAE